MAIPHCQSPFASEHDCPCHAWGQSLLVASTVPSFSSLQEPGQSPQCPNVTTPMHFQECSQGLEKEDILAELNTSLNFRDICGCIRVSAVPTSPPEALCPSFLTQHPTKPPVFPTHAGGEASQRRAWRSPARLVLGSALSPQHRAVSLSPRRFPGLASPPGHGPYCLQL